MIKLCWEPENCIGPTSVPLDQRIDHAIEPVPKRFPHTWLAFVDDEQCQRMALPVLATVLPIQGIADQWYFVVRS